MKAYRRDLLAIGICLLLLIAVMPARVESKLYFTDPVLESVVRKQAGKQEGELTTADAEGITVLDCGGTEEQLITSLQGIEALKALECIRCNGQAISDLSPLGSLTHLDCVELSDNRIEDLSPLEGLPIRELVLSGNQIRDVSPLAGMTSLRKLRLKDNPIVDLSVLSDLGSSLTEKDFDLP